MVISAEDPEVVRVSRPGELLPGCIKQLWGSHLAAESCRNGWFTPEICVGALSETSKFDYDEAGRRGGDVRDGDRISLRYREPADFPNGELHHRRVGIRDALPFQETRSFNGGQQRTQIHQLLSACGLGWGERISSSFVFGNGPQAPLTLPDPFQTSPSGIVLCGGDHKAGRVD